ncbi:hypothetical protein GYB59_14400 [bacterium]|nr:hypothetical protein [bacterium]
MFHNAELWRLWCWLLMQANITENWADENTKVGPGQMLTGRDHIAAAMGWKPSSARNRLAKLEEWGMIVTKKDSRGTLLTICNWQAYQVEEIEKGQQKDSRRTTEGQPEDSPRTLYKKNNKKKKVEEEREQADRFFDELKFPEELDTPEVRNSLREFVAYRQEIKKPATLKAMELILAKFKDLGPGCLREAVEDTIMNRWTGLYPPKSKQGNRNGNSHGSTTTKTDPAGTIGQLQRLRSNAKRIPAGD